MVQTPYHIHTSEALGDALGRNSEHSTPHSSTWVLWYGANSSSPRPDAHQGGFLPFENLRAGLRVSLSRTLSLSNRGQINVGSGLVHDPSALDDYQLSGNEVTIGACQEEGGAGNIFRQFDSAE